MIGNFHISATERAPIDDGAASEAVLAHHIATYERLRGELSNIVDPDAALVCYKNLHDAVQAAVGATGHRERNAQVAFRAAFDSAFGETFPLDEQFNNPVQDPLF